METVRGDLEYFSSKLDDDDLHQGDNDPNDHVVRVILHALEDVDLIVDLSCIYEVEDLHVDEDIKNA